MPPITVNSRTAISILAARLSDLVTTSIIQECAYQFRLPCDGGNKMKRLRSMLEAAETDRRPNLGGRVLVALALEGHARALVGHCEFSEDTLVEILNQARVLSWDVGDLRSKRWREGLTKSTPTVTAAPAAAHPEAQKPSEARIAPRRHDDALGEIARLADDRAVTRQQRGLQLELVVHEILLREGLRPQRNVVVPGEQIDITFDLGGVHYLAECKWLKDRVGDPEVSRLTHKVATRPVGVRGVILSMSGFVRDIETFVQRGGQQHCIGLDDQHLISVLEGRTTWSDLVLRGWRDASLHRRFLAPR